MLGISRRMNGEEATNWGPPTWERLPEYRVWGAEDLTVQPCNHRAKGRRAGSTWRSQTAVSRGKGKTGELLGEKTTRFWLLSSRKRPLHGSANVKGTHIDLAWPIRSFSNLSL